MEADGAVVEKRGRWIEVKLNHTTDLYRMSSSFRRCTGYLPAGPMVLFGLDLKLRAAQLMGGGLTKLCGEVIA